MRLYKRKGSPKWWASWSDQDGKRYRRSTGTDDQKLAEALAAQWVQEGFMERHFGKIPEMPFSEALLNYAKIQKRDHGRHYRDKTRYCLKRLQQWFGGFNLSEITLRVVQKFMDERLESVSMGTVQRDVSTLRAILYKAYREGLLEKPPRVPKFKRLKSRTRWITPEEEECLVKAAAPHLAPIIRLALNTGGRRSELLGLDWRYVDMKNRRLTFIDTKNGEDRTLRMTDAAFMVLVAMGPKSSGPVFIYKDRPMKGIKSSYDRARKNAGLEDVRFHDLRHTFASRLVQGGVPLYDVMQMMGHKSLEMVQRYSHLAPDYQERAVNVLNGFGHNFGTMAFIPVGENGLSA
ncbi:MAG: site-specific integrase [Rhodospirillales bacterium]|nr:site-specific integrase [Rhodospirillales bacterium]